MCSKTHDLSRAAGVLELLLPRRLSRRATMDKTSEKYSTSGAVPRPKIRYLSPPVTAKYFRVTFNATCPPRFRHGRRECDPAFFGQLPSAPTSYEIAEFVLHSDARVNHFEEKAAFVLSRICISSRLRKSMPSLVIKKSDVVDLTSKMQPDGTLDWTPPEGNWVVLAYRLLTARNHESSGNAGGYRTRSRQARPSLCEGLFREVS